MKVRAIRTGFYKGVLRELGDIFEIESNKQLGSWMEPVREAPPAKAPSKQGKAAASLV